MYRMTRKADRDALDRDGHDCGRDFLIRWTRPDPPSFYQVWQAGSDAFRAIEEKSPPGNPYVLERATGRPIFLTAFFRYVAATLKPGGGLGGVVVLGNPAEGGS